MIRFRKLAMWQRALIFVALGCILHTVLFYVLVQFWAGAIFLAVPAVGVVLGALGWLWFHEDLPDRFLGVFGLIFLLTAISALILMLTEMETAVCLVVGLPLLVPGILVGMWLARSWLQQRGDPGPKSHAVLLGLPILAMALDAHVAYPQADYAVQTVVDIAASPAEVWAHTLEIPPIADEERIWTMSHDLVGAPRPVSAVLEGDTRHLQWTKGVVFREIITGRAEAEYLAWDFDFHAPETLAAFDPHVSPNGYYLRMTRGEYRLEAVPGGTRLYLQSHYRLHTPFNAYLGLWGERFLQDFHGAVLAVIKSRAEA